MKTGNGKTGRPAGFDKDAALEAAMLLFWERGFEGTSMADLMQAMGLNPSSIYAAFGDKQALFSLAATFVAVIIVRSGALEIVPALSTLAGALFLAVMAILLAFGAGIALYFTVYREPVLSVTIAAAVALVRWRVPFAQGRAGNDRRALCRAVWSRCVWSFLLACRQGRR